MKNKHLWTATLEKLVGHTQDFKKNPSFNPDEVEPELLTGNSDNEATADISASGIGADSTEKNKGNQKRGKQGGLDDITEETSRTLQELSHHW